MKRTKELAVITVREILRLKELGVSNRLVSESCKVSASTVWQYWSRACEKGIKLRDFEGKSDLELYAALGVKPLVEAAQKTEPDYQHIDRELSRKGVTLRLLWLEYRKESLTGYEYSRFCDRYRSWKSQATVTMPQSHKAGEKLFVDYAGYTIPIVDTATGEILFEAQIFVASFGLSNYSYVEASRSQESQSWLSSHVRAFEYFGGVPEILTPDNLKGGVTRANYYEPVLNRAYQELASHYGVAVIPARSKKPKDKAKVENAVQNVTRWLLAPLRDKTFTSLSELNDALRELREQWANRLMKGYQMSRRELFEKFDKPALRPLPTIAYEYADWKNAKVNIDYHVVYKLSFYSVPYTLVREDVLIRATERTVQLFHKGIRVATHPRSFKAHHYSTIPDHMPSHHKHHQQWSPERLIEWASTVGPHTAGQVAQIIASKPHPEQGYRAALGLMRLASKVPHPDLENACATANSMGVASCKRVTLILEEQKNNTQPNLPIQHSNIRGGGYFH